MRPRKHAPTRCTSLHDVLQFRVWIHQPSFDKDLYPWKCLACFYYLSCCLDYIADCQDKGVDVIYQSPADCRIVKATETRVVYNGHQAPVPAPE